MKRVFSMLLISIGVLAYLFFENYNGELIPYPNFWLFSSATLAIAGLLVFASTNFNKEKIQAQKSSKEIERLKQQGEIIEVDLNNCEIISNSYYKQIPKNNTYEAQVWNSFYVSGPIRKKYINQSRLVFKDQKDTSEEVYISPLIDKDNITLSFILHKIGSTKIYADRKDKSLFYFDLEFLKSYGNV